MWIEIFDIKSTKITNVELEKFVDRFYLFSAPNYSWIFKIIHS